MVTGDIFDKDVSVDFDADARSSTYSAFPKFDEDGKLVAPTVVLLWDMLKVSN